MSERHRATISIDPLVAELAKTVGKLEKRTDFSNICEVALQEYVDVRGGTEALNAHAEFIAKVTTAVAKRPELKIKIEKLARLAMRDAA